MRISELSAVAQRTDGVTTELRGPTPITLQTTEQYQGIQRGTVQNAHEKHPLVVEFWDAPESHLGATVARLAGNG